jgi:hypothetical protein
MIAMSENPLRIHEILLAILMQLALKVAPYRPPQSSSSRRSLRFLLCTQGSAKPAGVGVLVMRVIAMAI